MAAHICDRCSKTLSSRQSLWNHRQRCKNSKEGTHETLGDGLVIEFRSSSAPIHKDKLVSDIINKAGKTTKDHDSALPKKQESKKSSVLPKTSDLPLILD